MRERGVHVTTINKKDDRNLKESKEGCIGCLGESKRKGQMT